MMAKSKPKNLKFLYETVARIVSGALKQEGTLRSLVFEHAKKFIRTHLVLAIEVTRHRSLLEKLISETKLVENEELDPVLAQVLVFELLLGKEQELPSGDEIFDRVSKYKKKLEKVLHKLQETGEFDKLVISKPEATLPRYGRVNTLLATLESVVQSLQNCGFELVDTEGKNYEEFLDCVRSLQPNEFALDFHFSTDLLVFNPSQYLGKLFVCRAGHLILHDKTSYFPVACLGAPPGSTVLDACAAPGMKTAHIAARMKNQGTLFAMDNNGNKMELLNTNLNLFGVQNCEAICANFLSVDPNSEPFNEVEYLLLDVPSSHSGNRSELMGAAGADRTYGPQQLKNIAALQFNFVRHALKFPSVKRIVYTTTSIKNEENEQVIGDVLRKNPEVFKLARAFPEWHVRGSSEFEFGKFCARTLPEEDQTLCSFVAVIERIKNGPESVESFSKKVTDVMSKPSFGVFVDKIDARRKEKICDISDNEAEVQHSSKKIKRKKEATEEFEAINPPLRKIKKLKYLDAVECEANTRDNTGENKHGNQERDYEANARPKSTGSKKHKSQNKHKKSIPYLDTPFKSKTLSTSKRILDEAVQTSKRKSKMKMALSGLR